MKIQGFRGGRVVASFADPAAAWDDGAVAWAEGLIVYVGPAAKAPDAEYTECAAGTLVTPGFVDAHTHAAWVGSRHDEFVRKMRGDDYREIAASGGGIKASARAIAAASEEEICTTLAARLRRMAALGVTTVEVKSGYGLEPDQERKQLAAIAKVAAYTNVPRVVVTFLALHAVPIAWADRRAEYVTTMASLVEEVGRNKQASFADAYLDANAFSIDEGRAVLGAAKGAGLGIRMHIGQFQDIGGANLAAELGASSVEHVEQLDDAGRRALAEAGVRVVLLPTASFVLNQAPPDVAALRAAGLRLVVASDANPGTAPTESLPLALALAVRLYGLTATEVLAGATVEAAASLGLGDTGSLHVGARADLVLWDLPHEYALLQPWGTSRALRVFRDGQPLIGV